MAERQIPTSREERLAAKLRENLGRRKTQAKAKIAECGVASGHDIDDRHALSKPPPTR